MGDELLACPFCGGEAKYYGQGEGVICRTCHAQVLGAGDVDDVPTWNRRASQSPPSGAAWGVKLLDWVFSDYEDDDFRWEASTPFGSLSVEKYDGKIRWGYHFAEYYDEEKFDCDSVDEGKAAAQAHWNERVSPYIEQSLTPAPSYAEGLEAAAKVALKFRPVGENAKHFVDVLVCDIAQAIRDLAGKPTAEDGADV